MCSDFFIALQKFINEQKIIDIYYEEAKKNASFPYGVISDPVTTSLRHGTSVYFDIYIWATEPIIGLELEKKLENLVSLLDRRLFSQQRAVIYFESQKPMSDPEFELIKKKITFSVRIF